MPTDPEPLLDVNIDVELSDELPALRRCTGCGCTDAIACVHADGTPCSWVSDDVCSACVPSARGWTHPLRAVTDLYAMGWENCRHAIGVAAAAAALSHLQHGAEA